jgi:hypothetical protein
MKTLSALTLAALAVLAACTSTPATDAQFDAQYEYGYFAGLPQRPTLLD